MRTDEELRADVMGRLDTVPALDLSNVDVSVDSGTVTLSGKVDCHQTRFHVERVIRRLPDIRALVSTLEPHRSILRKPN